MTRRQLLRSPSLTLGDFRACRRPDKTAFPSRALAKQALRKQRGYGDMTVEVYRCDAGHFHLGHPNPFTRQGETA